MGSSTKEKNPTKKIYISRRDSERRKCINEQELENELKKLIEQNENDFDLEELTSTFMNEIKYVRLSPPKT